MTFRCISFLALITILFPEALCGQLRLPHLISDGMVVQRDAEVEIWGWADRGEEVSVIFRDSTYTSLSNDEGEWSVTLVSYDAGGPYTMTVQGSTTITIQDIMIGEVWVSSGQSNMDLTMSRVRPLYKEEIAKAQSERIRYFEVPDRYNFQQPQERMESGSWISSTPETVLGFSAVSYFFARELEQKYDVPVGIINASLGGSPAESWISEYVLNEKFPKYYRELQKFKDTTLINRIQQRDRERISNWYALLNSNDPGLNSERSWYQPEVNTDDWSTMNIPGYWADTELGGTNGSVWFRKTIDLPKGMTNRPAKLNLGRIVDADSVFINGEFVGNTTYQYPPRWYDISEDVLSEGKNTLAVRVINSSGKGGFVLDKPYWLATAEDTISLRGPWKYKLGTKMKPLEPQTFIRWKPAGLFNAMIAPLLNYRIKGVIWYQGESNTDKPGEYRALFSSMIQNWREKWAQGDFPFLFVQLANFMEAKDNPSESNWSELREAQRQTLSVPNTAMAVAIDVGEWNDIHPLRKKEVGHRLALAAQKAAYHEADIVYSGPMVESMKVEGDKAVLSFSHIGSGLIAKGDSLGGFAIAGKGGNFVWASAKIEGEKIIVWSDQIKNPSRIRYGWADNPANANLYNREGLPASPFEVRK